MALIWAALRLREYLETDKRYKTYTSTEVMEAVQSSVKSAIPKYEFGIGDLLVAGLIAAASILYLLYQAQRRQEEIRKRAFPFMKLPAEIRAEVLKYLMDPPEQPVPEPFSIRSIRAHALTKYLAIHDGATRITRAIRARRSGRVRDDPWWRQERKHTRLERYRRRLELQRHPVCKHLNVMRLVSRKFGEDFLSAYRIHATPQFIIEPTGSRSGHTENVFGVWQDALPTLKHCTLQLLARPGMTETVDPRQANLRDWLLRAPIFDSMRQMTTLKSMTLNIEACGNPLWNPLWLWYLTAQAFMESNVEALNRIEFTMKSWPGMLPLTYLARAGQSMDWEWRCMEKGHLVEPAVKDMPIRPFCVRLYFVCHTCHPEADQNEED